MTGATQQHSTILVLGGTGKTGKRVVSRLHDGKHHVRVGSRAQTPRFDWQDADTWHAVLDGVQAVYIAYSPDAGFPGAAETIGAFANTAVAAGVERLVLLSGRGESGARRSELAVQQCGAEWTVVRSSFFAQNFSEDEAFAAAVRSGLVALPAGEVTEPFIDAEDIADVAVAALTEDGHAGRVYEVTGPRLLSFGQAVAEIAAATGRDMTYLPIAGDQFTTALISGGAPAEFATQLSAMFTEILDGRNSCLADGVHRALGRSPRDFADYVREPTTTGAWDAVFSDR